MIAILKIFFLPFVPFISKNKCTKFQVNSVIIRDFSKGGIPTIGSQKKPNPCRVKKCKGVKVRLIAAKKTTE